MKVDITTVHEVIKRFTDAATAHKLVEAIEDEATAVKAEEAEEKEKTAEPKVKKRFAVVVTYTDQKPPLEDLCAFVVQLPEDDNHLKIPEKIRETAGCFNETRKGQKNPIKTVGETFETAAAKHFKQNGLANKTKYPCVILTMPNGLRGK